MRIDQVRPGLQVGPPPPYDPQCGAVLANLPAFPPLTADGIVASRAAADAFMPRPTNNELTRGGAYVVDEKIVPGPAGAPEITLLVCRPAGAQEPVPTLYYIHGGGMIGGTARDALSSIVDLAESVSGAVVSVEYRLAPETPHPGPVEDCYAGLVWTAKNAQALNLDAGRLIIIGGSAGAGIAAASALMARDRHGPELAGQLLMSPMLDDRNDSPSVHQMAGLSMWNRQANAVGWTALLGAACGGVDVSPYASPARATDLSQLPPAFIDVGSADSFRTEAVDYASKIWLAGGIAELHVWPGGFHGFESITPQAALSQDAVTARRRWLRRLVTT